MSELKLACNWSTPFSSDDHTGDHVVRGVATIGFNEMRLHGLRRIQDVASPTPWPCFLTFVPPLRTRALAVHVAQQSVADSAPSASTVPLRLNFVPSFTSSLQVGSGAGVGVGTGGTGIGVGAGGTGVGVGAGGTGDGTGDGDGELEAVTMRRGP